MQSNELDEEILEFIRDISYRDQRWGVSIDKIVSHIRYVGRNEVEARLQVLINLGSVRRHPTLPDIYGLPGREMLD